MSTPFFCHSFTLVRGKLEIMLGQSYQSTMPKLPGIEAEARHAPEQQTDWVH